MGIKKVEVKPETKEQRKGISKFSLDLSELLGSRIVGNAGGHGLGLYGKFVKKAVTYDLIVGNQIG